MEKMGHEFIITAHDKDVSLSLLKNYGFKYVVLGKQKKSLIAKILNIFISDFKMYKAVRKFKPDFFLGIASYRAAHVSFLMRAKSIIFDDTEHSKQEIYLYLPFCTRTCTPVCFKNNLGKKQIRYKGYHELAYLHPNHFTPNPDVLKEIGVKKKEPFFILRFVKWGASHDLGQYGLNDENKLDLIKLLENHGKVFITSESSLDDRFSKYLIKVSPEKIHHLLYYALMCIGEGATMAVESALLGTPAIYISSLVGKMGNLIEFEESFDICYSFKNVSQAKIKIQQLLESKQDLKKQWSKKRQKLIKERIDVTDFMIEMVQKIDNE